MQSSTLTLTLFSPSSSSSSSYPSRSLSDASRLLVTMQNWPIFHVWLYKKVDAREKHYETPVVCNTSNNRKCDACWWIVNADLHNKNPIGWDTDRGREERICVCVCECYSVERHFLDHLDLCYGANAIKRIRREIVKIEKERFCKWTKTERRRRYNVA